MADVNDFTGSVDVNADITPTTRKKIEQVTPEKWNIMSSGELYDDRIVLSNRMAMAYNCGSPEVGAQIQKAINHIDAILQTHKQ